MMSSSQVLIYTQYQNSVVYVDCRHPAHRTCQGCPYSPASKVWVKDLSGVNMISAISTSGDKKHLKQQLLRIQYTVNRNDSIISSHSCLS